MKQLHRRPLLKKVALAGLSIGSVGSLISCSPSDGGSDSDESAAFGESDNTTVGDSGNSGDSSTADLIIDTTDSSYSVLANTGGSLSLDGGSGIPSPGILIHRSSPTSVNVVSRYCTHQGCVVGGDYVCACHNSIFAKDGSVIQGPASSPLNTYSATINGSNIEIQFS